MKRMLAAGILACFVSAGLQAQEKSAQEKSAQEKSAPEKSGSESAKKEPPHAEQSITQHTAVIGGSPVSFTATAGTLIVRNDKDEPWASMGYVAYVRRTPAPRAPPDHLRLQRRPRLLLDLAAHGSARPEAHRRRRRRHDAAAAVPARRQRLQPARRHRPRDDRPGRHRLQPPVGDFEGTRTSGASTPTSSRSRDSSRQYVSRQRPLGLAEVPDRRELRHDAFGRRRRLAAEQGRHGLQRRRARLGRDRPRRDLRDAGERSPVPALPAEFRRDGLVPQGAAEAAAELEPWLTEVRKFAAGELRAGAFRGRPASRRRRDAVVAKLHQYTGLSEDYLRLANLRVSEGEFTQELLRQKRITVGRPRLALRRPDLRPAREGGRGTIRNRTRSRRRTRRPSSTGTTAS